MMSSPMPPNLGGICMERLYDKSYVELIESLPAFSEYVFWENLKDRKIILNEDVNESLIEKAIIQIINWNEQDEQNKLNAEKKDRKKITIYIYSNGGDVIAGLGLISAIQNSVTPIHVKCIGFSCKYGRTDTYFRAS
jgi:ATP-dependent protease ClpP protease subunit